MNHTSELKLKTPRKILIFHMNKGGLRLEQGRLNRLDLVESSDIN